MFWRVALAAATVATFTDVRPAAAQFYDGYGRQPFWEQRQRARQQWQNDRRDRYYDRWGYDDDDYDDYRRSPVVRSGGARPDIEPKAPPRVAFNSEFTPNSIVIDTEARKLYYILSSTEAYAYPISVGREGFSWTGTEVVKRKQAWPDWHPPKEMIRRDPRLPDKMTGGVRNPLGALALYLGDTLYRIHGTNEPKSIGRAASSGCFRMMNEHVLHLASLTEVGTTVTVLKHAPTQTVSAAQDDELPAAQEPEILNRDADRYEDDDDDYVPRQRAFDRDRYYDDRL
jgi:lipoprotein-anchoring transpeptidase ErfK/SrfK